MTFINRKMFFHTTITYGSPRKRSENLKEPWKGGNTVATICAAPSGLGLSVSIPGVEAPGYSLLPLRGLIGIFFPGSVCLRQLSFTSTGLDEDLCLLFYCTPVEALSEPFSSLHRECRFRLFC